MEAMDLADDEDYRAATKESTRPRPMIVVPSSPSRTAPQSPGTPSSSEHTAVIYEAVFVKDNVSVHPAAGERITGRLRLIKQGPSLFMTWIPYSHGGFAEEGNFVMLPTNGGIRSNLHSRASEKDRNLYTIRAVSVAEMRSIRRHTPALGWHYVIIVLTSGLAFPPLYFQNGGVREFLSTLKEYALLVRSADDANVYLINDIQDPLQRSLTQLDLAEVAPPSSSAVGTAPLPPTPEDETVPGPGPPDPEKLPGSSRLGEAAEAASGQCPAGWAATSDTPGGTQTASTAAGQSAPLAPTEPGREFSIQVLEKFSFVTKFARETTTQLLARGEGLLLGSAMEAQEAATAVPEPAAAPRRGLASSLQGTYQRGLAGVVAAKQSGRVWVGGRPMAASEAVMKHQKRDEEAAATEVGSFELVDGTQQDSPALVWARARPPPLGPEEWVTFLDNEGRVMDPRALRRRVFHGGIEPSMRREVWKLLLGYYPFSYTHAERQALAARKAVEYSKIKAQWQSVSEEQAKRFAKYRERRSRVDKDVVRTDRMQPFYDGEDNPNVAILRNILITYSFYNFDLGYCQGMSDLLSPILYVMCDEAEAFWCFAALMERMAPNFHRDQNGMHSQLLALQKLVQLLDPPLYDYLRSMECLNFFFCFRWILIHFKREFEYDTVLRLWEVLWTRHLSDCFHLYVCVAILKRHRRRIMDEQMEFDTLLRFINELSGRIDLESTLRDAEALCIHAGERGAACMPPVPSSEEKA